ncbi:MAG: family metallo-hydrolase, partial [Candidatus Angelobacter sp.]|nr:family metallo-hydrolase [Candidatus Angelobacter sp.]
MSSEFEGKNANNTAGQSNESSEPANPLDRRHFLVGVAAGAAAMALPRWARGSEMAFSLNTGGAMFQDDLAPIRAEINKRHDETVQRMQTWIKQPSIAAENRGMNEGCELTMQMLRDAGFQQVTKVPTDGQPGIFATLDAGAPKTLGLYFMYDVKQVDPSEW